MTEFKLPEELLKSGKMLHIQKVRLATSIGLLVIEFNRFEYDIGEFLAVFMKRTSQAEYFDNIAIMTAALSFGQKLDLLSALYLKRYEEVSAQCEVFRKVVSQLSKYEEYRNTVVHSRWGTKTFGEDTIRRFKPNVKGRKGLRQVAEEVDWRQIRVLCKEMSDFYCRELFEIYIGCSRYEEMSEKTIAEIKESLEKRSKELP